MSAATRPAYKTEQEAFWAGEFGKEYVGRNRSDQLAASNLNIFSRILSRTQGIGSVIEFGANVGMNLRALHQLLPAAALAGVEINEAAAAELKAWGKAEVFHTSLIGFAARRAYDLAFFKGVLIHINPDELPGAYDLLAAATSRYALICEYYNPTPVSVTYRGHEGRLFKRDFAGEFLDRHPGFHVVDYAFHWRRDPMFPQDDTTWFLLERR
jgi:spore coat polysaccharide biosynthesis protein SpsF